MKYVARSVALFIAAGIYLQGHELSPTQLSLRLGGQPGMFKLQNGGQETDCTTTIGISVDKEGIVSVQPTVVQYSTPPDDHADFTVTPLKPGTVKITVTWIAGASDTCNGRGAPTVFVTVDDIPPPPQTTANVKQQVEPVAMDNGAYLNNFLDLRLRGPLPLYFERYYYSALQSEGIASSALGANWMHNYDMRLTILGAIAEVSYYYGRSIRFANNGGVWSQTSPDQLVYQLQQSGTTYKMLDPASKLVYTFSAGNGVLQSISDRNNNTISLSYTNGLLSHVADGLGATLDFVYTGGNLVKVTDQSGRSLGFGYTGGVLTSFTDPGGKTTSYRYTGGALLAATVLPRGNTPTTQTYDSTGAVSTQQDAAGDRYTFSFSTATRQSKMTDPLNQVYSYTHLNRNLTQDTNPAGDIVSMTYDASNRLSSRKDGASNTTSITYTPAGLLATTTFADGTQMSNAYNASQVNGFTYYDIAATSYPDGTSEKYQYDSRGNLVGHTGRNGQQWTFTYNSFGQPLSQTNPDGGKVVFGYSQDGTSAQASIQYPGTAVVALKTDKLKRIISRTRADGSSVSFTYDAYDHILTQTNELGGVASYGYDANGLLTGYSDPNHNTVAFTRTGTDRIATITDPAGRVTTLRYDALDRISGAVRPDGSALQFGYDAAGNLTTITDGAGKVWKTAYDRAGNATSYTDPLGNQITLQRDSLARPVTATLPGGQQIAYSYDRNGNLVGIKDALNNSTTFQYDKAAALTGITLGDGTSAQFTRDASERVTAITDPNGSQWRYTFDGAGSPLSETDPIGQTSTFQRDSRGRIIQQKTPLGTVALNLDGTGRVTHAQYSDGTAVDYGWDAAGRLSSATGIAFQFDASGLLTSSNGVGIARDPAGRIRQVALAPGKTVQYTYDARGLVTQIQDWAGGTTALAYDDASRLISITRPNGIVTSYTYDANGDIATIQEGSAPLSSISLTRDQRGFVSQAVRNVPAVPTPDRLAMAQTAHTFDAASQVAEFSYDSLGRRLSDDTRSYTWDLASHLTSFAATDGTSSAFTYDASDLITSQAVGGQTFQFVWNYGFTLPSISVVRSSGSDFAYYIHTPDGKLLYSVDAAGNRSFYHFDEQGNKLFLSDDSGNITDQYVYTEYGALLSPAATGNWFTFGGQYGAMNLGSNLYAMRQRVYDSGTAAFLSRDPKTHRAPHLVNPYEYAAANPLNFIDATGADPSGGAAGTAATSAIDGAGGAGVVGTIYATDLANTANGLTQVGTASMQSAENLAEVNQAAQAIRQGNDLAATAGKVATVSKVGVALKVVSIGINAYQLHNANGQAANEYNQNLAAAQSTFVNTVNAIWQLYNSGRWDAIHRNNMILQAKLNYIDAIYTTEDIYNTEWALNEVKFLLDSAQLVPFVNDGAVALGNLAYK